MNVLQVTAGNRAYPPDTGGYQRTHGLMLSFTESDDFVHRYCCSGILATYHEEGELLEEEVELTPALVEKRHYSILHDIPKIVGHLGCPVFAWPATLKSWVGDRIVEQVNEADVVMADSPHIAVFLAENTSTPTVYSSHNIEYERYLSTNDGWLSKSFGNRYRRVEEAAARKSDLVVCTTERDCDQFSKDASATAVIPNGIAGERITGTTTPAPRAKYDIPDDGVVATFLGSDYGPNVEAVDWLAENWSKLDEEYHLLILGDSGDSIETEQENVHTTGYVEDLQAALAMADIALNPIFSGGGSNVKLLDYFAAELPVVSTPFGSRGFELEAGEDLLLAEKADFFGAIDRLGSDESLRRRLGTNGQRSAAENYTWESLSAQLRATFAETLTMQS
ncbi:glycosyltransferase family 4 protein [Halomicroarcula sp. F28]|uniref:glycosyltransferase family 4 protein n=1 Tax=Haloarcula salinisoli TaxID=2487746 RepID=UPI001C72DAF6|nr:glycosyltransferase family 4 protein [Halomicroarcula salinisoli]MBX0286467.1 glycosyltransferase family 4 protein [Halomicroarcula salinisoli]